MSVFLYVLLRDGEVVSHESHKLRSLVQIRVPLPIYFYGGIMLDTIKGLDDVLTKYLADDPVRPSISKENRFGENKDVFEIGRAHV